MTQFRQSRTKLALSALIFAVWTAILGFMGFVSAHAEGVWPYLAVSLFAPLAVAGAIATASALLGCWRPATLTVEDTGVVFANWRSERRFAWETIADFVVMSPEARLRSPGLHLKSGARRFVSFGRNWVNTPEAIVDLLRLRIIPAEPAAGD